MIFGPFPIFFIEKLREILTAQGGEFKIYKSEEALAKFREELRQRPATSYPTTEPQQDLLFIELMNSASLMMVKAELIKMGVSLSESDFNPEFQRGEYLCLKCDHTEHSPALCPVHRIPLLEFSVWAKAKVARKERIAMRALIFFVVLALGVVAWTAGPDIVRDVVRFFSNG